MDYGYIRSDSIIFDQSDYIDTEGRTTQMGSIYLEGGLRITDYDSRAIYVKYLKWYSQHAENRKTHLRNRRQRPVAGRRTKIDGPVWIKSQPMGCLRKNKLNQLNLDVFVGASEWKLRLKGQIESKMANLEIGNQWIE